MPRVYCANTILRNALYDADRALRDGQGRVAMNILSKKLIEIEKIDKAPYLRLKWD